MIGMKNIAFTICSNNYLAQAKVLSDSVYEYSRGSYDFYIVLCDVFSEKIDYTKFHAKFVEARELGIENFEWMTHYYDIIELNTAIKPFAFKYLINKYNPLYIHYLDPDTCTYTHLNMIEKEMEPNYTILLTPHSFVPLPFDGGNPTDNIFLNNGIFNLGFLGLKVGASSNKMLDWWCDFMAEHCLNENDHGFFVDQLPMNLVPLYFENVKVSRNKGINVAYWNLHERSITLDDKQYMVDGLYPLVLFHFSSYNINNPKMISKYGSRIDIESNFHLNSLFADYASKRKNTEEYLYKSIKCVYNKRRYRFFRRYMYKIIIRLKRFIDNLYYYLYRL